MFLKLIKDFSIKKNINTLLSNPKKSVSQNQIQTIGLLIDETYFSKEKELINAILEKGFHPDSLSVLIYKDKIKKKEQLDHPFFCYKDVTVGGEMKKMDVNDFVSKPFDMLISYYDVDKPVLKLMTIQSKSLFKIGFSSIDDRINDFMINTRAENHNEFITELFKYLRILKKI